MCWVGLIHDKKIAKKDITVYKVLHKTENNGVVEYYSPFVKMPYELGKTYSEELWFKNLNMVSFDQNDRTEIYIKCGIHCFDKDVYLVKIPTINQNYNLGFYVGGKNNIYYTLYSFRPEYSSYGDSFIPVVIKCTIPKGSTYYANKKGEIVTSKIRFDKDLGHPQVNMVISSMNI